MNLAQITENSEAAAAVPHLEAEGGGNGNGVGEDVGDVRDGEALLEIALEL